MKNKLTKIILTLVAACVLCSCTENQRTRHWGGTSEIILPPNQKLVVATWKDADLWYLTRPMRADENAEIFIFKEQSNFGLMQGTITFKEQK
jgi:hypothetical protein